MTGSVQFDHGPSGAPARFSEPLRRITAHRPDEVAGAFVAMEAAVAEGHWLAGYAAYELGYALDAKLSGRMPESRVVPLLDFGVFTGPEPVPETEVGQGGLVDLRPEWDAARYDEAFQVVHDFIGAGDIYQANLTLPLSGRLTGDVAGLYVRLAAKQPVPYGALVQLGDVAILSRSPELFFSLNAEGVLTTRPMKGTVGRGATPGEDADRANWLRHSPKDQAENLMIVDLLRNDMSRISEVGSVKVPDLFTVETYATLHQMTSRITSQVVPETTIGDLFTALFPCGSITGAPKIRSMEILSDLEDGPRGAYCGSIGWIGPDRSMEFNVAIRTLTAFPDGTVTMAVGGGLVYDSTATSEYAEALLKADFARLD